MNVHYEELLDFLVKISDTPALMLSCEDIVFKTEPRLYSSDASLNHRLAREYLPVREKLYEQSENHCIRLLIKTAVAAMSAKLKSYNKDHLPEGRYWDPSMETQEILSKLKPHNDKTESVFGVNDWLNRILPSMSQATQSVMIEFSANKTMEWLKNQAGELKVNLITLARKNGSSMKIKKQDAKLLVERKMHQRAELVK